VIVQLGGCPIRKLYPTIFVVQAAEHIACDYASVARDRSMVWGVLAYAQVSPRRVVIMCACVEEALKMPDIPHYDMVETFSPD
jgi:hypothetical protein